MPEEPYYSVDMILSVGYRVKSPEGVRFRRWANGVARAHKAERLWVFGSCARREERPDSDVDLLFEGRLGILDEIQLQEAVSQALGVSVDMVSARALHTSPCFAYNVRKDMVAL